MKHWIRLLTLFLLVFVAGKASAQNVATVGGTDYATLQAAFNAATDGQTVTLLGNYDATGEAMAGGTRQFVIKKSITFDGAGYTLTTKERGIGIGNVNGDVTSNINVTVKNITINNSSAGARCIDTRGKIGSLTLDGVTLSTQGATSGYTQPLTIGGNQSDAATITIKNSTVQTNNAGTAYYAIITFNPVNMTISNSTVKGWACIYAKGPDGSAGSAGSVFTIDNSTLVSSNAYSGVSNSFGAFVMEDDNVTINVANTNITLNNSGDQTQSIACFNDHSGAVNLGEGNNITFVEPGGFSFAEDGTNAEFNITGGAFNVEVPEEYLADGHVYTRNANGTYTVVEGEWVATISNVKYATLQEAIDAANGGEAIMLLKDINMGSAYVNINKGVTIDGDGHTITSSAAAAIEVSGTGNVTISNTKINATAGRGVQVGNVAHYSGKLTINEGTEITVAKRGINVLDVDSGFELNLDNAIVQTNVADPTTTYTTGEDSRGINFSNDPLAFNTNITNSEIRGFSYCINVYSGTKNLTVNMTGGKTYGRAAVNNWGDNNTFNLDGVEVHGINNETGPTEGFACIVENNVAPNVAENNTYNINDCTFSGFVSEAGQATAGSSATQYMIDLRGTGTTVVVTGNTTYTTNSPARGGIINDESQIENNKILMDETVANAVKDAFKDYEVTTTDEAPGYTLIHKTPVAKIGNATYYSLQDAVDAAHEMTGDVTVTLLDNITEVALVHQKAGLNLTIDGEGKSLKGQIYIDGDGRLDDTDALVIKNIKFAYDASTYDEAFVYAPNTKTEGKIYTTGKYNYDHNVTITDCEFAGEGTTTVAVRVGAAASGKNLTLANNTVTDGHSFAQLTGVTNLTITNNNVTGVKNGINISGGGGTATITGNTLQANTSEGYTVRFKDGNSSKATLENNTFGGGEGIVNTATGGTTITINSGYYAGPLPTEEGKVLVNGGYFTIAPALAVCAEGLYPIGSDQEEYPYTVGSAVASVTDSEGKVTYYASLESAFAAAPDGSTIKLLVDASGNGIQVPQGKYTTGLTVDFGGFTYTMDGEMVGSSGTQTQAFQLLKDNKITFKNGTITSEKAKMLVQNYSDLTLENMTLTLNNPNYTSAYTLSNNNGNVVIDGSTINANPAGGFAFDVCRYSSYPSVSVTVKGESVINGDVEVFASNSDALNGFTLMLKDGTISGDIVLDETAKAAMAATPDKAIVRKSDTFDQAAPEGYKWVSDGEGTGTSTLAPRAFVAQIGDVQYYSLADAVAAVPANGTETTIVMIADETFNDNAGVTIPAGKNIILDLNGKTVSQYAPDAKVSHLIENKGTLTIKDSSDTNKDGTGTGKLYSEAAQPSSGYAYASNLISNSGQLTIESGYLQSHTRYASYVVDNYPGGNAVINGGHLYNFFTSAIRQFCNSTSAENSVTVNNGIIEGYCTIWMQSPNSNANKGSLTINGGTFQTTEKAVVNGEKALYDGNSALYMYPGSENMSITINDGIFNDNIEVWEDGKVSITGGIFNGYVYGETQEGFITGGVYVLEVDDEYIAEGYKCGANTDEATKETNPYAVIPRPYVAQIGDVKYWSLADAVAAVPADGTETTITMIDNEMIDIVGSAITIPATKNVVIDLNGFQVVGTAAQATSSALITNKGTLTIKDSSDTNADGTGSGKLISGATETWIYNGDGNYAGSYASNTITNSGTLNIQSGYIENLSTGSATYAVDNNSSGGNAILNMNGGVLKAHSVAVREFANSTTYENTINMAGGTIQAGYAGIWIQLPGSDATKAVKAALNVTGGTITGGSYSFYDYSYGNSYAATQYQLDGGTFNGYIFSYGANMNITGGTYNSDVIIKQTNPSTVSVSGGKFAGDVYTYGANASEAFISGGIFASTTYEEDGETYDCDWPYLLAEDFVVGANTDETTKDAYPYMVRPGVFVAQIVGGAKYESLAEAIAAVPANGTEATTIKLLVDNLDEDAIIDGGKNIILDLNEKTLKGGIDQYEGNVTLTNGTLQGTVYVNGGASSAEAGYNHFTLANDATINAGYGIILWQGPNGNDAYGSVIDINGAVNGNLWVMGNITEGNSMINVNSGASIKGEVVGLNGLATLNVKDGATIESSETGIEVRAGVLNVTGGTITSTASAYTFTPNGSGTTTTGAAIAVSQHNTGLPIEVNVLGGTLSGVQDIAVIDAQSNDLANITVVVKDELITNKSIIPDGFAWISNGDGTSSPKKPVAKIGETLYASLNDAVAAVPADGTETTIVMIANDTIESNAGVTIPASKNVVLDLNGKTITGVVQSPASAQVILNKGTLTITDSSDGKNGTITNEVSDENAGSPMAKNWYSNVITNNGTLTVNAGNIANTGTGGACYAIDNITNGTTCTPTLNIAGGNISAVKVAVRMFCNSTTNVNTVNVTGGVISSENAYAIQTQMANKSANKAALNISGGTLSGQYAWCDYGDKNTSTQFDNASYSITGGFFSGYMWSYATYYCGMEGFISGGYFDDTVSGDLVAPGKACVDNTDEATMQDYPYTIGPADVHYYWLDNNGNIDGGGYYTIYAPFAGPDPVLMDGEFVDLMRNVTLTKDIEYIEEVSFGDPIFKGGTFTLTFGDYDIDLNGFNFPIPLGVSIITDKQKTDFFSAPAGTDYIIKEEDLGGGKFKYTCMTKEDAGIFELLDLVDDNTHPYTFTTTRHAESITYRRSFKAGWTGMFSDELATNKRYQPWYVPFNYTIKSEDLDHLEFFKVHLIAASAAAGEVSYNKKTIYIYLETLSAGDIMYGNRPYMVWVKDNSQLEFVFTAEDTDLLAIDNSSRLDVSTAEDRFDFFGTYKYAIVNVANSLAINTAGRYVWRASNQYLRAYRWYIKATSRTENTNYAEMFVFNVEEGNAPTSIDDLNITEENEIEGIYTIDGKKLDHPMKGLNIIKMKDNTVKKVNIK